MSLGYPLFLLLLAVVPALALVYRWLTMRDEKARAAFADAGMSARLGLGNKGWRKKVAPVLIMLAAALAAIAIARPLGPPSGDEERTAAMDVIVALDISDSMGVADVKPNRLTEAKEFVKKLVLAAPNNRYGLVLFSGDAIITCPPTLDHDAFLTFVDDADFPRANLPGTAIGEAILTAATTVQEGRASARGAGCDGRGEHIWRGPCKGGGDREAGRAEGLCRRGRHGRGRQDTGLVSISTGIYSTRRTSKATSWYPNLTRTP